MQPQMKALGNASRFQFLATKHSPPSALSLSQSALGVGLRHARRAHAVDRVAAGVRTLAHAELGLAERVGILALESLDGATRIGFRARRGELHREVAGGRGEGAAAADATAVDAGSGGRSRVGSFCGLSPPVAPLRSIGAFAELAGAVVSVLPTTGCAVGLGGLGAGRTRVGLAGSTATVGRARPEGPQLTAKGWAPASAEPSTRSEWS